jgi:hypothetical protein
MATTGSQRQYGGQMANPSLTRWQRGLGATLLATMVAMSGPLWAQPHTSEEGPFILRASTVSSETLPESTASEHGIQRDPRRGVLNVVILHKEAGAEKTLQGDIQAIARNLSGQKREVAMKEVTANGYVSYMGTYEFVRGEVIDFLIEATPRGSDRKLSLSFRDRMWLVQ